MKILVLSSWCPYPTNSGGRIRTRKLLEFLRASHQVDHLTFCHNEEQKSLAQAEGSNGLLLQYESLDPSLPPSLRPFETSQARDILASLSGDGYNVTLFDQLFVSNYWRMSCGLPVLFEHNIESQILRETVSSFQGAEKIRQIAAAIHLEKFETDVWARFPLRICVSERDANLMRNRCGTSKVVVADNGVDAESIPYRRPSGRPRVLLVGALDYLPNEDAAYFLLGDIMPLVWEEIPEFQVAIAGRSMPSSLIRAAAGEPRILLYDTPEEIEPLARNCFASVVPLRMGSGTRLKILEAAARGLPVVTTSKGCEGLRSEIIEHLVVADTPDAISIELCRLWRDEQTRLRFSENARRVAEKLYHWPLVLKPVEEALCELVGP